VVDGDRYRWRIQRKITYCQGNGWGNLTFAVGHFDKSGATLIVKMPQAQRRNWMGEPIVPVLRCNVEYSMRQAIARGWKPSEPGSSF
jgi:hypothetical protein